jgi:DNA (cytosine-5)-methyltransferase 1
MIKKTKYSNFRKLLKIDKSKYLSDDLAKVTHYLQTYKAYNYLRREVAEYVSDIYTYNKFASLLPMDLDIPYPPPHKPSFTFIDLFAGIGGFRIAFQNLGGKCVFSSEINRYARKTYERNFGEVPFGDICQFTGQNISDEKLNSLIPDHDILTAGFPCQPFSLAGVSKKNSLGRKHGFEDPTQGTLFFDIKRIINVKQPRAFFLENVKNLLHHDKGKTFQIILDTLEKELGYVVNYKIVDAGKWVPQHRERTFIVGFNPDKVVVSKGDIIIPNIPAPEYKYPYLGSIVKNKVDDKYTLGPGTWDTLERHKKHHSSKGNGFGYGIHSLPVEKNTVTRTISARYHKDGAEILIAQPGRRPRRLTVNEAMQLQGYDPKKFVFPVSDSQAYKQIGNSVAVPAIQTTGVGIVDILHKKGK